MYRERMIGYFPNVISAITEFKAIIDAEYPEFESQLTAKEDVLKNAYLLTMDEGRIEQWENILGISPMDDSSIQDRRDTIIARIRGQGKLNTALINSIVNAFTGGTAISWVKDSVLYVEITPPPTNKQFKFANVEQELRKKIPAHLGLNVRRNYASWMDIKDNLDTWQDVYDLGTWQEVCFYVVT